jgi:hypothetical protein
LTIMGRMVDGAAEQCMPVIHYGPLPTIPLTST